MTILKKTVKTEVETEVEVEGVEQIIEFLFDKDNLNLDVMNAIRANIDLIALPWHRDSSGPPRYVRALSNGVRIGIVDSHLGGYGIAARPRYHGWGYKGNGPTGQGLCDSGIVSVEWNTGMSEEVIKQAELDARDEAMKLVDAFLREEFPAITLMPGVVEKRL